MVQILTYSVKESGVTYLCEAHLLLIIDKDGKKQFHCFTDITGAC